MNGESEARTSAASQSMRSVLSSLAALMGSSFFVHLANSAITTMIALVGAQQGGAQSDVAFIAASYSTGFIFGCFLTPRHVARIGLIRAFAAAAAVLTISIVALDIFWILVLFGLVVVLSVRGIGLVEKRDDAGRLQRELVQITEAVETAAEEARRRAQAAWAVLGQTEKSASVTY